MISTSIFIAMIAVWLTFVVIGILDLDNRVYLNIGSLIVAGLLAGLLALLITSGSIVEANPATAESVLFYYEDAGIGWFFGIAAAVCWIVALYLGYEAYLEYQTAQQEASMLVPRVVE